MAEEVKRAAKICANGKAAVVSMFQEVRMGNAISAEAAGELVDEISSSVLRNPGALISLARLKTADDYTYMHSVAVCALMVALARQLGLDEKDTREAGMAGLLHDLGKALMPMDVLNKPGKLTDAEFTIIKSHPVEGHRLLVEGKSASAIVLDVCLHHHEKVDGSGYPDRLPGDKISLHAKMGAVCDVYDAITSNRPYKAGWDPAESIRKMTEWSKGHFDDARLPGLREEHRHLPDGFAGEADFRTPCRGGRTVGKVAAGAAGQGILFDQVASLYPARDDRPVPSRHAREDRRPRGCGEMGHQESRRTVGDGLKALLRKCHNARLIRLKLG